MSIMTRCVYRVHTLGEIQRGMFDWSTGQVVECPQLLTVDTEELYYAGGNYEGENDDYDYLETVLLREPKALVAAGYNRIGAIVANHTKSYVFIEEGVGGKIQFNKELIKDYGMQLECVGVVATQVNVFTQETPMARLFVDTSVTPNVVHTRFGTLQVGFKWDKLPADSIDMSRYVEMCKNDEAYAFVMQGGKPVFLKVDGQQLRTLE